MSTSELKQECCVVTIGRFNPPTKGHVYAVFKKLVDKATKNSCRGIILTTPSTISSFVETLFAKGEASFVAF